MADIDDNTYFTDSDDDLLGITDNPIHLRSLNLRNKLEHKSKPTFNNNNSISTHLSNEEGWIHCRRPRKNRVNFNKSIYLFNPSESIKSKRINNFRKEEQCQEYQLTPTMEIINVEHQRECYTLPSEIKQNKYQRMREVRGIIGFIVNVHDATNFDIDLEMSPELHEKYGDVISNQYTYQEFDSDFLENPVILTSKDTKNIEITPKIGTTYRCRLRGVGINQLAPNVHTWKSNQMCVDVKQLIDRTDGWITCTLSDIDVFQRLLVDITINTSKTSINLRDYLLSKMEHQDNPIFYPYSGKLNSNNSERRNSDTSNNGFKTFTRTDSFNFNRHDFRNHHSLTRQV